MKAGPRMHKSASLRVVAPALPDEASQTVRETVLEIACLESGNPRKGHATALMREVIAEADRSAKVLMLTVGEDASFGVEKMVAWYSRLGFVATKDDLVPPVVMVRSPVPARLMIPTSSPAYRQ